MAGEFRQSGPITSRSARESVFPIDRPTDGPTARPTSRPTEGLNGTFRRLDRSNVPFAQSWQMLTIARHVDRPSRDAHHVG
jgi:hypothetical protein